MIKDGTYKPTSKADPIRCYPSSTPGLIESGWDGSGWYFWDETWDNLHGPFSTIEDARESLTNYAKTL